MSRYDYRDPGTDPSYCNGLSAEPDEPIDLLCFWCNRRLVELDCQPYCSPLCAVQAAVDSEDN